MSESQRTHYSCGEIVGRKLMACAPAGLTVLRLRDAIHVGILLMPLFGHVKDQCALVGSDREITLRQTGGQYALLARCGVDGTQFAPSRSLGRIVISVGDRHPRHIGALAPAAHETLRTGEQRITLHRTVGTRLLISGQKILPRRSHTDRPHTTAAQHILQSVHALAVVSDAEALGCGRDIAHFRHSGRIARHTQPCKLHPMGGGRQLQLLAGGNFAAVYIEQIAVGALHGQTHLAERPVFEPERERPHLGFRRISCRSVHDRSHSIEPRHAPEERSRIKTLGADIGRIDHNRHSHRRRDIIHRCLHCDCVGGGSRGGNSRRPHSDGQRRRDKYRFFHYHDWFTFQSSKLHKKEQAAT